MNSLRDQSTQELLSSPVRSTRKLTERFDPADVSVFDKFLTPCAPFSSLSASPDSGRTNPDKAKPPRLDLLEKIRLDFARKIKRGSQNASLLDERGPQVSLNNSATDGSKTSASTPMAGAEKKDRKSRLCEINAQLATYEKNLEHRTMSAVQAETSKIQIFKDAIASLDKKVQTEIRQRIESHRLLKNVSE
eukprot:Blabericola_migrator_1__7474@NODE_3815_length_1490_cov_27_045678_g2367_i0_p1_GENE_NODE_3815_length_1490_cov_27_045678_g2367_i0NODE_3815_length_1490_cov_27_045678_g2367_i0_p1_ORF_typecomplete_len191_score20_05SFassemblin/PF06705_11/6_8e06Baculo_p24/PF05073_12/0_07_NODE_3815_length_1490_cov_27_045678_g2367_i06251197